MWPQSDRQAFSQGQKPKKLSRWILSSPCWEHESVVGASQHPLHLFHDAVIGVPSSTGPTEQAVVEEGLAGPWGLPSSIISFSQQEL